MYPLAIRRRPRDLREVHGQNELVGVLSRIMASDARPHFIFGGASGTGKTSIALALAAAEFCSADGDRPCHECDACLLVAQQNHPALHIVNCAHQGGKEDIGFLLTEETGREPVGARRHLVILEEADKLSLAAQSALLVPLQETTGHRQFIFTCIDPNALIRAARDRCRTFRLELPNETEAVRFLQIAVKDEEIDAEDAALDLMAANCRGYRNLLETLETAAGLAGDAQISTALLRRTVLRDRSAVLLEYLGAVAAAQVDRQLALLDACALTAPEKVRAIREILAHLRTRFTGRRRAR